MTTRPEPTEGTEPAETPSVEELQVALTAAETVAAEATSNTTKYRKQGLAAQIIMSSHLAGAREPHIAAKLIASGVEDLPDDEAHDVIDQRLAKLKEDSPYLFGTGKPRVGADGGPKGSGAQLSDTIEGIVAQRNADARARERRNV